MEHDYSIVFPVAAVLILIILGLLLQSVVAPWYLMIFVGLGFAATLGASVGIFQDLDNQSGLSFILPIMMYLFVVALGTDYNILMVSRLREEATEGKTPREAAAEALKHAGPTIASAGPDPGRDLRLADPGGRVHVRADGLRDLVRHRHRGVRDGDVPHAIGDGAARRPGVVARAPEPRRPRRSRRPGARRRPAERPRRRERRPRLREHRGPGPSSERY